MSHAIAIALRCAYFVVAAWGSIALTLWSLEALDFPVVAGFFFLAVVSCAAVAWSARDAWRAESVPTVALHWLAVTAVLLPAVASVPVLGPSVGIFEHSPGSTTGHSLVVYLLWSSILMLTFFAIPCALGIFGGVIARVIGAKDPVRSTTHPH